MSGEPQATRSDQDGSERINRELIELLNELRVALPGVQVLFAFLLAVPFSQGFATATTFQRDLFFAVLVATAISAALLIAPSAWHRVRFRQRAKEQILLASNRMAIAGLGFLAVAMVGAVMLISDYVFSEALTIVVGIVSIILFGGLWYALPVARQLKEDFLARRSSCRPAQSRSAPAPRRDRPAIGPLGDMRRTTRSCLQRVAKALLRADRAQVPGPGAS